MLRSISYTTVSMRNLYRLLTILYSILALYENTSGKRETT
jgi:hypothetical protein